jgi:hypothetical protein
MKTTPIEDKINVLIGALGQQEIYPMKFGMLDKSIGISVNKASANAIKDSTA